MQHGRLEAARNLLKRSLKSLSKQQRKYYMCITCVLHVYDVYYMCITCVSHVYHMCMIYVDSWYICRYHVLWVSNHTQVKSA